MTEKTQTAARVQGFSIAGENYALKYDWESFARFCDAIGCTLQNIDAVLDNLPVSEMPSLIWAGLSESAPEVTPAQVRAELKAKGLKGSVQAVALAAKAFQAALADDDEDAPADGAAAEASAEKKPASR